MSEYQVLTPKLHARKAETYTAYIFMCPACSDFHIYYVGKMPSGAEGWEFNGDLEKPTFRPSLLLNGDPKYPNPAAPRCHMIMAGGQIHYCGDCSHAMAGQTVDIPDMPVYNED